jgi:cytochrome c biogenesis protein
LLLLLLLLPLLLLLQVEGLGTVLEDIIGSTGLEIKNDPGVPLVYAGM